MPGRVVVAVKKDRPSGLHSERKVYSPGRRAAALDGMFEYWYEMKWLESGYARIIGAWLKVREERDMYEDEYGKKPAVGIGNALKPSSLSLRLTVLSDTPFFA